jgi:ribosomal protein S18 acetylase RimI-like enzyme
MSSRRKRGADPHPHEDVHQPVEAGIQFSWASHLPAFLVRPLATRDLPFFFQLDESTCVELMGDASHAYDRTWIERIVTASCASPVGRHNNTYSGWRCFAVTEPNRTDSSSSSSNSNGESATPVAVLLLERRKQLSRRQGAHPRKRSRLTCTPYVELFLIAVHEQARRRGIGNALLRALPEYCKAEWPMGDTSQIRLHVLANNTTALNLYQQHGFHIQTTKQHYPAVGYVSHRMVLNLV